MRMSTKSHIFSGVVYEKSVEKDWEICEEKKDEDGWKTFFFSSRAAAAVEKKFPDRLWNDMLEVEV